MASLCKYIIINGWLLLILILVFHWLPNEANHKIIFTRDMGQVNSHSVSSSQSNAEGENGFLINHCYKTMKYH